MEIRAKGQKKTSLNKGGQTLKKWKAKYKYPTRLDRLLQQRKRPKFK